MDHRPIPCTSCDRRSSRSTRPEAGSSGSSISWSRSSSSSSSRPPRATRQVSSRRRASRCRCAAAGRPGRAPGSRRGADAAATGIPGGPLSHPHPRRGCLNRLDRVGGGAEVVGRDVGHVRCLRGGVGRKPWCTAQVAGRSVRMTCGGASHGHRDLPAYPRPPELDRAARTIVVRTLALEQLQDVPGAVGRPDGEEAVGVVVERPAATDRDEPRVADLREDQRPVRSR